MEAMEDSSRHITQYHYLVWKDFQAPEHPYGILKFIKTINSDYSVQRGPLLIHCSAGMMISKKNKLIKLIRTF